MNRITVFTPTYNRCYTLGRLLNSLVGQTNHEFDWYVIDDGSTDGTEQYFENILKQDIPFYIRYERVENGGKQRAINRAVQKIETEFIFIVDSDDYLLPNALEKVYSWIVDLPENIAGVSGVKGNVNGEAISGEPMFDGQYIEITNLKRKKYNLSADMAEIYRTELLRKYPFKVWQGEKFVPEAVVWDEIALHGYPLRWYKDIIYICEYLEDGLTKGSWNLLKNNPMGYAMMFDHQLLTETEKDKKWNITVQMMSCLFLAGEWKYCLTCNEPWRALVCTPIGFVLSIRRKRQFRLLEENHD